MNYTLFENRTLIESRSEFGKCEEMIFRIDLMEVDAVEPPYDIPEKSVWSSLFEPSIAF